MNCATLHVLCMMAYTFAVVLALFALARTSLADNTKWTCDPENGEAKQPTATSEVLKINDTIVKFQKSYTEHGILLHLY